MWTPETKTDKNLTLWVTHECNLNCKFCRDSANKGVKGFMTMQEVKDSLNLAKKKGITTILIGGGEPTLHPNVVDIAKLSKSMGFFTVITTNYTKPEIVKQLDGICDTINISVYEENKDRIPSQKDFKSNIFLKVLLYKDRFPTRKDFDNFIDKYLQITPHMSFCCMRGHSKWCQNNKEISWLPEIEKELDRVVITDRGNPCWVYRGLAIDRKDLREKKMRHMMIDVRGIIFDEHGNITHKEWDS